MLPPRPPPLVSLPPAPRVSRSGGAAAAFPDPFGPDPSLEEALAGATSLLAGWFASAASSSPLPGLSVLPSVAPLKGGLPTERLLADLQRLMEGAYNPSHPGALAHLDPPPLVASMVGDLIAAALNNNLLAEELSPSLTRLERSLCGWLAGQLGLPRGAGGVPASGGSLSNLMALVVARHSANLEGCADAVVLCSEDAHVSLGKALRVMGLPPSALRSLPVDEQGRLQVAALEEAIDQLQRLGIPVIAVVATAGTTVRGAVDPLEPMAALCRRHGLWLHVDGAIGAVFALAPAQAHRVAGLGLADSITVNPQKLLGITKTSSLLLLARPALLASSFATGLPYMEPGWGGAHGGESGLQGTRPAEILKLWLGLRQLGLEGIAHVLEGAILRCAELETLLAADGRLLLRGGTLHLLAFRPAGLDGPGTRAWSERTRQALLAERLMLSRPLYQGMHHLKAVLGNPHTRRQELECLARCVEASL